MLLKADRLAALLDEGRDPEAHDPLIITPAPDRQALRDSGAASVDLRLGTWFVNLRHARLTHLAIGDERRAPRLTKTHYVRFSDQYVLHPRAFVLGVTLEWLRLPRTLGAYVIGKSSWGRRGLIIATATGVHPGFKGCLTLELSNVGEIPVSLQPGMPVCQLFVHNVEAAREETSDTSQFVGMRKPTLGRIQLDPFAQRLAEAMKRSPS